MCTVMTQIFPLCIPGHPDASVRGSVPVPVHLHGSSCSSSLRLSPPHRQHLQLTLQESLPGLVPPGPGSASTPTSSRCRCLRAPVCSSTGLPSSLNPGSESSKPGSREASPAPEHHSNHKKGGSSGRDASPKTAMKDSVNELQSIQRLVSGLEGQRESSPTADSPK